MTTQTEALKLALDRAAPTSKGYVIVPDDAFQVIKEALTQEKALQALHDENERLGLYKDAYAQPEQEPVAWMTPDGEGFRIRFSPPVNDVPLGWDALYTTPPQRKPLTDEQIDAIDVEITKAGYCQIKFARAIEAAHGIKEKNT